MKNTKKANKSVHLSALKAAFPHTVPIMAGFLFLGASYGVLMASEGFSFLYPMATSILVFAGSMEFALAGLLLGGFDPLSALILTLMINSRHIFYGISMIDKYKGMGLKKIYMIFSLCDETFSVAYTAEPPPTVDRGWFTFYISLLDHSYWVIGATLGGIFGSLIPLGIVGFDFAMTALFVVILLEQLMKEGNLLFVIIGGLSSVLALLVFGQDSFIIPAMLLMLLAIVLTRSVVDKDKSQREEPS
ncbi:MAG: AzlC family ABC transporter permease [Clostridia bacterium]|nr:AzlC family ABC transporter permease [Clostridia bacterium]